MGKREVRKIIDIYLVDLKRKIKVEKAILFGSFAKGKIHQDSDVDLVIISPSFNRMSTHKRFNLLYEARENPKTWCVGMDIFGFTPKEYDKASPLTILGEVKETGIEVQKA